MTNRKKPNAQDLALRDVAEFPNFIVWATLSPEAKSMVGATHDEKRAAYEEAFEVLMERVLDATSEAEPCAH
jgi:hypothetical protein